MYLRNLGKALFSYRVIMRIITLLLLINFVLLGVFVEFAAAAQ